MDARARDSLVRGVAHNPVPPPLYARLPENRLTLRLAPLARGRPYTGAGHPERPSPNDRTPGSPRRRHTAVTGMARGPPGRARSTDPARLQRAARDRLAPHGERMARQ